MAGPSNNTMSESLMKLLKNITELKTLPDADIEWIVDSLEVPILTKIREPLQAMYQSGASAIPPMAQAGAPAGGPMDPMGPMVSPSAQPQSQPAVGGIRSSPQMGGAVEAIRRAMANGQ